MPVKIYCLSIVVYIYRAPILRFMHKNQIFQESGVFQNFRNFGIWDLPHFLETPDPWNLGVGIKIGDFWGFWGFSAKMAKNPKNPKNPHFDPPPKNPGSRDHFLSRWADGDS